VEQLVKEFSGIRMEPSGGKTMRLAMPFTTIRRHEASLEMLVTSSSMVEWRRPSCGSSWVT